MSEAKKLFLLLIGVAIFIVFVGLLSQGRLNFSSLSKKTPPAKTVKIGGEEITLLIAQTPEERSRGLSNREKLESGQGMLFIFDSQDVTPAFWMKDMRFAIDIIWINDERVVQINQNVEPEPGVADSNLKLYAPPGPIDYVLEVNAGTATEKGFKVGDAVDLSRL
jgi:uncharacterized membrane protein (UPF0127 family)